MDQLRRLNARPNRVKPPQQPQRIGHLRNSIPGDPFGSLCHGDSVLDCLEHTPGDGADRSVIWLHGLGASGNDFAPLVPHIDLPRTRFVFPQAPMRPVTVNGGHVMPAWYDIRHMERGPDRESVADIRSASVEIEALIARELQRGVQAERIVLAGFSQGAAMTLHTGLRYPHRLAGLMVLSGYLVLDDTLDAERSSANAATPMFFGHGSRDDMVPLAGGKHAHERCAAGRTAEWHTYNMGHELCAEELRDIKAWLHQTLR
jgi:phospholipase/carboxylesterase